MGSGRDGGDREGGGGQGIWKMVVGRWWGAKGDLTREMETPSTWGSSDVVVSPCFSPSPNFTSKY